MSRIDIPVLVLISGLVWGYISITWQGLFSRDWPETLPEVRFAIVFGLVIAGFFLFTVLWPLFGVSEYRITPNYLIIRRHIFGILWQYRRIPRCQIRGIHRFTAPPTRYSPELHTVYVVVGNRRTRLMTQWSQKAEYVNWLHTTLSSL